MKKSLLAAVLVAAATMGLAFGADNGRTVQFGRYYEDKAGKKLTPIIGDRPAIWVDSAYLKK